MVEDCQSSIVSLAETQDKQCLLVGCLDSKLRLIDKDNGQVLSEYVFLNLCPLSILLIFLHLIFFFRYTGHLNRKYRINSVFNKNDSIIISGSENGSIFYWNLLDSKLLGTVNNDNKRVIHSLATNPNVDELLSASENKVYLWTKESMDN